MRGPRSPRENEGDLEAWGATLSPEQSPNNPSEFAQDRRVARGRSRAFLPPCHFCVANWGAACLVSAPVKKLVLVDGTALIFRAYFAIPASFATTSGLHTNAIFGFATMFRKLFAGKKPDYGVVVFDSAAKTFREEK